MASASGKKQPAAALPIRLFEDAPSFERWLEEEHASSPGVRLHHAKKGSGVATLTYNEALEICLCYGWIDSQKEAHDDRTWLQRYTPRGKRSIWSQVNKEKAERLIAEGRMRPAGLAAIEAAKQGGEWDRAYEAQSRMTLPDDFAAELAKSERAKAFFETLNGANRFAILFRIGNVKKQETRERKIRQFIEMLERGEKLIP
ncbi:YdeI/OmpD-associated family protein [Cohnella fermenti]|uniref:Bacteriocin-protection protein n=1 Tax=Cohnella fermenti TaxID=2565925 RepID=A0A4S4C605_9BACL|nr:YdeI/OmpD-associated family protein [Cohnella fermenti]THF82683.1 bacteriocin-protection protein [Cohnella fermenti]